MFFLSFYSFYSAFVFFRFCCFAFSLFRRWYFFRFFRVFREVRICYGLDDINLPKKIKKYLFPRLCFIEARWSATQRLGAQPSSCLCDKWLWLCSQALGCASSRRDEAQPRKNDVFCSLVNSSEIGSSTTARTDVLPGKVRFDYAGPMFSEIPRVVRLGKRMTNFSLISSTSSSSSSSASSATTSTSSTSSTSQLTVKFNGGGEFTIP